MKKLLVLWVPILLTLLLVVGCSSTPTLEGEGADVSEQSTGAEGSQAGTSTSAASEGGEWLGDPLENPNSLLATRVIYFDFDQSAVRAEYLDVIQAHADYLAANPQVVVRLEGHADEKGTREYNLGLGENRANSVRSLMLAQGVSDNQLVVVSYGEERPATFEHNEESWALNRRVELVY
ncbi:MAG: peptidoglycan-associated lipoprotein [gamma proteobacterium symbiont of Ctena orbiculata]|nr:MAG: peptidoglycan-associated lipoprotein [gamma proteobacterium symbiont of Ctena orbiculata]PVV18862.1 MAG: peptidoglycan-associated lipoprotein [gamma proteobacterium symbiont of Ctena orbiculata]PVV18945.1 MAG: peptidoglycan-associated lipoprotein [gamma proteobacterium symbiont of Ctena orbiculata]